jgi:hypothetical protein
VLLFGVVTLRIHLTYYSLRINFYRKQFTLTIVPSIFNPAIINDTKSLELHEKYSY